MRTACALLALSAGIGCVQADPSREAPDERLEQLAQRFSRDSLRGMAIAGGDWILGMQDTGKRWRGRFTYEIDPSNEEASGGFRNDNFLRQAGTTYSLFLVHEATGKKRYLTGAKRGVDYLLTRVTSDPELPGCAYFEFNRSVKLGGTALPLLSLLKLSEIEKTERYEALIGALIRFLVTMQQEDGEFRSIYRYAGWKDHPQLEWDSAIYPGEAMLALTRRYAATRDESLLEVLDRAQKFYGARKDRYLSQAFIPWTTTAMVELYELTGQERFANWALEMTDFLVGTQILDPDHESFGAFRPQPGANTGSYLEGILDAYRLALLREDSERVATYRLSALAGYSFLSELQYDKADAERYPNAKQLLLGGFRGGPGDASVRIDNTQHAISAIVKGIDHF